MACLMGIYGVSVSDLVLICFNRISLNFNGISLGLTGFHEVLMDFQGGSLGFSRSSWSLMGFH